MIHKKLVEFLPKVSLNKIVSGKIKKTTKETPKHRTVIFGSLQHLGWEMPNFPRDQKKKI
jgi:hypothetical protein